MKKYNVAVVGATGMVGRKFLEVLTERNLPVENYYLFASAKSAGTTVDFMGKPHKIIELKEENLEGVVVDCYDGLLADYAQRCHADVIVKGLRAVTDFEYEFQMALTNSKLNPTAETVFLTTSAEHMYLSSSLVKQVAHYGGDISTFVPSCIVKDINEKYRKDDLK